MRLRWTHRLRDYLAERDYYVENRHASILSEIREVELISDEATPILGKRTLNVATSPPPPDPTDFEVFRQCYSSLAWHFTFKEKPARADILTSLVVKHEINSRDMSLAEIQQNGDSFHVIWLSDMTFVSCMEFSFQVGRARSRPAMDYEIHLQPRTAHKSVCLCAHSLDPTVRAPSIHRFLSKMLEGYAEDYFSLIRLGCHLERLSSLMSFNILSIIPSNSSSEKDASPPNMRNLTTVQFACDLDTDTVQAILLRGGQKKLPIRYKFRNQQQLGAVLRDCSQLSHICVDESSYHGEALETSMVPFTESCCL
jgi:hypothetical protein